MYTLIRKKECKFEIQSIVPHVKVKLNIHIYIYIYIHFMNLRVYRKILKIHRYFLSLKINKRTKKVTNKLQ